MNELKFPLDKFKELGDENRSLVLSLIYSLHSSERTGDAMVSTDEAADMLKMSRVSIVSMFNKGELKGVRISPRKILISRKSVLGRMDLI